MFLLIVDFNSYELRICFEESISNLFEDGLFEIKTQRYVVLKSTISVFYVFF